MGEAKGNVAKEFSENICNFEWVLACRDCQSNPALYVFLGFENGPLCSELYGVQQCNGYLNTLHGEADT